MFQKIHHFFLSKMYKNVRKDWLQTEILFAMILDNWLTKLLFKSPGIFRWGLIILGVFPGVETLERFTKPVKGHPNPENTAIKHYFFKPRGKASLWAPMALYKIKNNKICFEQAQSKTQCHSTHYNLGGFNGFNFTLIKHIFFCWFATRRCPYRETPR